jgi:DNA-binding IclR family transcriptional regulator
MAGSGIREEAASDGRASAPLSRAARIVDVVASAPAGGLTLNQISDGVDLPLSTTHRMVQSLLGIGYLAISEDRKYYQIGRRLMRVVHAAMGTTTIQSLAEPVLSDMVRRVNQVCYLTQLLAGQVRLVAFSMPESRDRSLLQPGETSPIHASAMGKALLAYQDADLIERHLAKPLPQFQPGTITDPALVRAELKQVRERGYAVSDSEFEAGVFAIACPVELPRVGVVHAVGVVGLKSQMFGRLSLADYVGELQVAARELAGVLAPDSLARQNAANRG